VCGVSGEDWSLSAENCVADVETWDVLHDDADARCVGLLTWIKMVGLVGCCDVDEEVTVRKAEGRG